MVSVGQPIGHAVKHAAPGIAATLEHFAHEPEGDAGDLHKPEIGTRVVVEVLAEPEPVDIGEVLEVEVGAVGEAVALVVLVRGVKVDESAGAGAVEDLAQPLHRRAVEGDVVDVEAVDFDVVHQPVKTFQVIVVPARHAAVDNGGVLEARHEPGGDVVGAEVLLQPGKAAARASGEDLVAKAAQGEDLRRPVGELTHGVVDLHLHVARVRLVDIGLHLVRAQERVVDVRVDLGGVVHVDGVRAQAGDFFDRREAVVEARAPLLGGIDGPERRERQAEVEVEGLLGAQGARPAAASDQEGGQPHADPLGGDPLGIDVGLDQVAAAEPSIGP